MLEALRNSAKSWPAKIFFAILILGFASWGIGDVVQGFGRNRPAIEVGNVDITAEQVAEEFRTYVRDLQGAFGGKFGTDEARQLGLVERAIDNLKTRAVLAEAANDLGLAVDDETIRRVIATNPAFRNPVTGQFDQQTFRRLLAQNEHTEQSFVALLRQQILQTQLVDAVAGGVIAPAALVQPLHAHRGEQRVAETLFFATDKAPAPPPPDADTLKAYHEANQARFMAPEYRAVTAVILRPADVTGEVTVEAAEIEQAYQARLDEFQVPERRTIQQIVLDDRAQADKAGALVAQGKDLAAIAKELDKPVADLGSVESRDLPPELGAAAFALDPKAVSKPVKTALGWHVVRVTKVEPGKTRTLDEAKAEIAQALKEERALDRLYELSNQLEDVLASGATLEEAAKRLNLKTMQVDGMDLRGQTPAGQTVAGLPTGQAFLTTAFQTPEAMESSLTELEDRAGYFVVRVDKVTPPAVKPFEDVKKDLAAAWTAEQRAQAARTQAEAMAERLKKGESMERIAAETRAKLETTRPFTRQGQTTLPPALQAQMFQSQAGGVAVAPVQGGAMVARLKQVLPADSKDEALAATRQQVNETLGRDLMQQYQAALERQLDVTVNRALIDERLQ